MTVQQVDPAALRKSQMLSTVRARLYSSTTGMHLCDTLPGDSDLICLLCDVVNKIQKQKLHTLISFAFDEIIFLSESGTVLAKAKILEDRDKLILLRERIRNDCVDLRAVPDVQGGMRFDTQKIEL